MDNFGPIFQKKKLWAIALGIFQKLVVLKNVTQKICVGVN